MALTKAGERAGREAFIPVAAAELRIGMYVWLDCPWFKHPFPRNRFKIRTAEQIALIRGSDIERIYIDPQLSDSEAADSAPEGLRPVEPVGEHHPSGGTILDKVEPQETLSRHQEQLRQANRIYAETVRLTKGVARQICAGQEAGAAAAHQIVEHLIHELLDEEASLGLANLVNFKELDQDQVLHSLNTCVLAVLLGRDFDLDREQLKSLGLAALLHDIGEYRVPTQVLYKGEPLTRAEKAVFHLHPQYGKELIRQVSGFPPVVAEIIHQHHEHLDGSGYPRGLSDPDILFPAQIVRIVDEYSDLVNPRDSSKGLTPTDALAHLYAKRDQQLAEEVITRLVRILSVYPPGTIVELTDGAQGVVLGINFENRLRPLVGLYEAGVAQGDMRVIDLAEERGVSVARSLRPADVPKNLLEWMNPQQILGYLLLETHRQHRAARPKA